MKKKQARIKAICMILNISIKEKKSSGVKDYVRKLRKKNTPTGGRAVEPASVSDWEHTVYRVDSFSARATFRANSRI